MAAPVFQSTQKTGWSAVGSIDVTKPVSLAVGDLMICHVVGGAGGAHGIGGFTSLNSGNDGAGDYKSTIGFKIADSGDVAASLFTFTGASPMHASVSRITGAGLLVADYVANGSSAANTATPSIAAGVTPVNHGDSTLLMMFWTANTATTSIATYAIATSNPTWTESYDVADTGKDVAMAYATRPEFTATGNISCAGGTASTDWVGQLVSIAIDWTVVVAESTTLTEAYKNNQMTIQAESTTLTETITTDTPINWSNQTKNSSTWSNLSKS